MRRRVVDACDIGDRFTVYFGGSCTGRELHHDNSSWELRRANVRQWGQ
jgi:hypothetical protein